MADFPENQSVNPVLPPNRPRPPGKKKPPVDQHKESRRERRHPPQDPDDGHVLDEYA